MARLAICCESRLGAAAGTEVVQEVRMGDATITTTKAETTTTTTAAPSTETAATQTSAGGQTAARKGAPVNVLVAGAGPVGLTMAAELARYGLSVRIVDTNEARTDKSKALAVWSRTLELLERMSGTAQFVAAGLKVRAANIWAGSERIAHVDISAIESPYNFVLMLPQSETERSLEEYLATLGVKVERRTTLDSFVARPEGVRCTLRRAPGHKEEGGVASSGDAGLAEEIVEAKWLVGCDGAHSAVRHALGMEFEGGTMPSDFVLADVRIEGVPGEPAVNIYWHADGLLAIFPMAGGRYRTIADVGVSAVDKKTAARGDAPPVQNRPDPTLGEVQKILETRGDSQMRASDPQWTSWFTINERKVNDYRAGRVFLAGDAAHIHSPAGGQGMNTGMQDAMNLAWKLALVTRGLCVPEPLLDSYSSERSGIAQMVLEATGKATSIAVWRGRAAQTLRNHVAHWIFGLAPVGHAMADALSEISVGYPKSPLSENAAHMAHGPNAGKRAPLRAGEAPVGAGRTPLFAVFADDSEAARKLLARYAKIVEPALRKPFVPGEIWVVRPDGYVGLVGKSGEFDEYKGMVANREGWEPVDAYFRKFAAAEAGAAAGAAVSAEKT
jgi:2-polyprenyl-6-methoxyphenol hydroxylase-like FAD-dependent oxidoreductase